MPHRRPAPETVGGLDPQRYDDAEIASLLMGKDRVERDGYFIHSFTYSIWGPLQISHTVGFTPMGYPEIGFYGIGNKRGYQLTDRLLDVFRAGHKFAHGDMVDGILNHVPVAFIEAPAGTYVPWADDLWAAEHDVYCLQMIPPDRDGKFPWDNGYSIDNYVMINQPPSNWREYAV